MAKKEKVAVGNEPIYDATQLGVPKMLVLGFQHTFAMFGATVLVPLLTGLDIATTLLMAGLGTLFFHLVTKGKVPAFLGSSFAFLGGYAAVTNVTNAAGETVIDKAMLPYACLGVAVAGLVYLVLAILFAIFDSAKIMKFFPPVVTGPIIIAIGLGLAGSAVSNCETNWLLAIIALGTVIIFNIWGKGMSKIVPILLGIIISCIAAVIMHNFGDTPVFDAGKIQALKDAAWIGFPVQKSGIVFGNVPDKAKIISAIIAIVPISLATMMEHIGDISAISATTAKTLLLTPASRKHLSATVLQQPSHHFSVVLQTQHTVKTQAFLLLQRFMTPE